jgi:hypothetical protein
MRRAGLTTLTIFAAEVVVAGVELVGRFQNSNHMDLRNGRSPWVQPRGSN